MKINLTYGDIFSVACDAYVNPTDIHLSGSGGLDKKIHSLGGAQLEDACALLRGKLQSGEVKVTTGGALPVKFILHAVCPKVTEEAGDCYEHLYEFYLQILLAASGKGDIHHLALPLVGTGSAGYSLEDGVTFEDTLYNRTAVTILSAIASFPGRYIHARIPEEITIVCSSQSKFAVMDQTWRWLFGTGISKRSRIRASMLCGAVGDAFGYPVEFKGDAQSRIREYILDPQSGKALISDDTQMTLFTACGMLWGYTRSCMKGIGGDIWHYIAFAYEDWLVTQDPGHERTKMPVSWIRGIPELNVCRAPGLTCLSALREGCGSVGKPVNNSKGCGGVMRIAPLPLYGAGNRHWDQNYNARACAETAALTHGHPLGWLSAVALGNILWNIMHNFSLEYAVAETIRFLKKRYAEYPDTNRMVHLIAKAKMLADISGQTSSVDLMAEFNINRELGEGWVGEEALAVALFCVLANKGRGFAQCMRNAAGHKGDSDSTASIAGQIWGAYFGESEEVKAWLPNLELRDVIEEIADDMASDCRISEYSANEDPAWYRKYLSCGENAHIPHEKEYIPYHYYQIEWPDQAIRAQKVTRRDVHGKWCGEYEVVIENGDILHRGKTEADAHTGSPGFGFTNLHFNEKVQLYEEYHGYVKSSGSGAVKGFYLNSPFTLLPNQADNRIEIFCDRYPHPWVGSIRRQWDEWNNPISVQLRGDVNGISIQLLGMLISDHEGLRNVLSW